MAASMEVQVDTAQPRIKSGRLGLTVAGEEWNGPIFSETWLILKTNTLVCNPAPLRPDWHTSNTGPNARLGLSDFGLTDGTDGWRTHGTKEGVGAVRLFNPKGMTAPVKTTATFLANRAFFVSYFPFNVGNDNAAPYFDCGIGNSGNNTTGVSFRFWSGGQVDVYKQGTFLATYTLGNSGGTQTANRYVDLLIIPARTREITVYSITSGDSFTHVFTDIDPAETNPVVTPNESLWFWVPKLDSATKYPAVDVEIAPVFWHDGYATSLPAALGRPPKAGAAFEAWDNAAPFASVTNGRLLASGFPQGTANPVSISLVGPDGSTAFSPNGTTTDCLMRVDLVGGTHTPFVDAAHMAYKADVVVTTGDSVDVAQYVRAGTLEVPDSGDPAEVSLTLGFPAEVAAAVANFLELGNRPAQFKLNGVVVIDGVTLPVKFQDGEHDGVRTATLVIRDRMHSLREAALRERMPLDGLQLSKAPTTDEKYSSAVEFLYRTIGLSQDDLDLDDVDYAIPRVPSADSTKFCHLTELGAHPFDELQQLHDDLASDFLWGIVPKAEGPRAVFKDPDEFSTSPDYTLYRSDDDAAATDGANVDTDVYWSFRREPLEIEANEVRASGYDPMRRRAIQAFKEDAASKDPAAAPASRPDNWLGEERVMGILNKRLTTQEACNRVVESVFPKVSARYYVAEWGCEMMFKADGSPIWRGDLVKLDGQDSYRVSSLRVTFVREAEDMGSPGAIVYREATYTGGTLTNAGGVGLDRIRAAHARRAVAKTIRREGADEIAALTPLKVISL